MKAEDIDLIAALCRTRAGLRVDREKTYLIESRIGPIARREGFDAIGEMMDALRVSREDRLIWILVEAMALGETSFFRDREAFDLLRADILPTLARQRAGQPLRIWSAACSTGQEAYSLAMLADEAEGLAPGARVEIFGSDISDRALEKAQAGLYTQFEVQRGLPIRQLLRHFEKTEEMWRLAPRIAQRVRWRRINLIADLTALGQFDIILARNVLSTLEPAARTRVLQSLAGALAPDGVLMLGLNETPAEAPEALRPAAHGRGLYIRDPTFQKAA